MRKWILAIALLTVGLTAGCAGNRPPTSLTGIGVTAWQANEAVIALDAVMSSAIALNELQVCDPQCHSVLNEQNTRLVVQTVRGADLTLKQFPLGWPVVISTALEQIQFYLDDAGKAKMMPYITAARTVLESLRK